MRAPFAEPMLSLVEAVCYRPQMYTLTGTLEEALCFLEGFYSGMLAHTREPARKEEAFKIWYDFLVWSSEQLTGTQHTSWHTCYSALRVRYPHDSDAFPALLHLYRAYRVQERGEAHG